MLVSGIPTLMIAGAAFSLSVAAFLTIVDHYDKRPNEHHYQTIKVICYKAAFYLIISAPFVELFEFVLLGQGIDIFPHFNGFASDYTFYAPELKQYLPYIDALLEYGPYFGGVSFVMLVAAAVSHRYSAETPTRINAILFSLSLFGLSCLMLLFLTQDFLVGAVKEDGNVYMAINQPAKFNAILLTQFILASSMFLTSFVAFTGIITNRFMLNRQP